MKAVIIAGGRGERLGYMTAEIPKPMVRIVGKPVLEHQIDLLRQYGITDISILIGHLGHVIKEYFRDGKAFGVDIEYYSEEKPLGTSGCLKVLKERLQDDFLLLYGDLMLDIRIDDFMAFHRAKGGAGTLVVHPNDHPYDSDLVVMDDDYQIVDFLPKDRKPQLYANLVTAAFYVLSPQVLKYIPDGVPSDFVKDVFPDMIRSSRRLYGYKTAEYIKDMGTADRLEKVSKDFSRGKIQRLSKLYQRPAIFMDRDGTLVEEVDLLHRVEDLTLFPFASSTVKKINDSDFLAVLVTNQPVVARNLCDLSVVKEIHKKLETLLGREGAYLNDIYFCPHHPDRGYSEENAAYKISCDCRKPKTGMIKKAVEEYNIDIKSSWLIGDTTTDIQTGINAGMQTILLKTGKGGRDGKFSAAPDFIFDDLNAAVDFILGDKQKS